MKRLLSFLIILGLILPMFGPLAPIVRAEDTFGDFEFSYKFIVATDNNGEYEVPHDLQMSDYFGVQGIDQFFDIVFDDTASTIEITPQITEDKLTNMFGSKRYPWACGGANGLGVYINLDHHMPGVDVLQKFIDLEDKNGAIIGCESGGDVDSDGTQSTNFFILFWRDIDETVSYTDENGASKSIRIIAHKDPAEYLVLGDLLVSAYYSLGWDMYELCLEEEELRENFSIEIDRSNGIVSVTPLCTKQEFLNKASGNYDDDICAYIYFASFQGDLLSGSFAQLNGNFTEVWSGPDIADYISILSVKLWTENDETIDYTDDNGNKKTIRIITHALPDGVDALNGDYVVDYHFQDIDQALYPNNIDLVNPHLPIEQYFDVDIDHINGIITVTPKVNIKEFETVTNKQYNPDLGDLYLAIVFNFAAVGADNPDFSTLCTDKEYFLNGPVSGSPSGESNLGIVLWTENDETVTYTDHAGNTESIRIITHVIPTDQKALNDDFIVEHTYVHKNADNEFINKDELEAGGLPLDEYFTFDIDYDDSTITVTPLCTKEEFMAANEAVYGRWDDLTVAIEFIHSRQTQKFGFWLFDLTYVNYNFLALSSSGDGWRYVHTGIRLWTENDETVSYTNEDGESKFVRFVTHALPNDHKTINGDMDFSYRFTRVDPDYEHGVDESVLINGGYDLKDYFRVSVDYDSSTITVSPTCTRNEFEERTGGSFGDDLAVALDLSSFKGIMIVDEIIELAAKNSNFLESSFGDAYGWAFNQMGIKLWSKNEETLEYSVGDTVKAIHFITLDEPEYEIENTIAEPVVDTGDVAGSDEVLIDNVAEAIMASDSLGLDMEMVQAAAVASADIDRLLSDKLSEEEMDDLKTVEIQSYIGVKLLEVSDDAADVSIVLDIEPMYRAVAVLGDGTTSELGTGAVEVTEPVEIVLFVGNFLDPSAEVSIRHIKREGEEYTYAGEIDTDGYLRFTNPNGFSVFEITTGSHSWGEAEYIWSDDNDCVIAKAVCSQDPSHVREETVRTVKEVIKEATTEEEGQVRYTAVFEDGIFETQTKLVTVPREATYGIYFKKFANTSGGIIVQWNAVKDPDLKSYALYRSETGKGQWVLVKDNLTETKITDTAVEVLESGRSYDYKVVVTKTSGNTYEGIRENWPYIGVTVMNAPTCTRTGIRVTWPKVEGATKYVVMRSIGAGAPDWKYLTTVNATDDAVQKFDTKAGGSGSWYAYTVRAVYSDEATGEDVYGGQPGGRSILYRAPVKVVKAVSVSKGVRVTFRTVKAGYTYRLYRSEKINDTWTSYEKVTDLVKAYTGTDQDVWIYDETAEDGHTYKYYVRCVSKDGKVPLSSFDNEYQINIQ